MRPTLSPWPPALRPDGSFTRGFVASACLSTVAGSAVGRGLEPRRALRHGLQGGVALAAGAHAAAAVHRRDYGAALGAAALGLAGVMLAESLLADRPEASTQSIDQEQDHGQET